MKDRYFEHFFANIDDKSAGSGNGLVPLGNKPLPVLSGIKPLPEPKLTGIDILDHHCFRS